MEPAAWLVVNVISPAFSVGAASESRCDVPTGIEQRFLRRSHFLFQAHSVFQRFHCLAFAGVDFFTD